MIDSIESFVDALKPMPPIDVAMGLPEMTDLIAPIRQIALQPMRDLADTMTFLNEITHQILTTQTARLSEIAQACGQLINAIPELPSDLGPSITAADTLIEPVPWQMPLLPSAPPMTSIAPTAATGSDQRWSLILLGLNTIAAFIMTVAGGLTVNLITAYTEEILFLLWLWWILP